MNEKKRVQPTGRGEDRAKERCQRAKKTDKSNTRKDICNRKKATGYSYGKSTKAFLGRGYIERVHNK